MEEGYKMDKGFNLSDYMGRGIENIINSIMKASLKNPKETAFVIKYAMSVKGAKKKRNCIENNGLNIPHFLISSITSSCNLYCKGCYARANHSCGEGLDRNQLPPERWGGIFKEAAELGIAFILLAGGEPLMRKDVLKEASEVEEIIFPIFTNGIMLDDEYLNIMDKHRNLVPVLSMEGDREQTDGRRGEGTYDVLVNVMESLKKRGILFGVSVTVTTKNIETVSCKPFFEDLYRNGCRALIFVEYVPVTNGTEQLAPTEREREILEGRQASLRMKYEDAIFLSFPGDEKYMGGCIAAGRGFFHINANGGAEPCPFSPFSDINLRDHTLLDALKSPLFRKLREAELLLGEHDGGCVLFEKEEEVRKLLGC